MRKIFDDYLHICHQVEVNARNLYIEKDDIEKGIMELIYQHSIRKIIMGAIEDKRHSLGMMDIESKKAKYVEHRVPFSCQIGFICNTQVICIRDAASFPIEAVTDLSYLKNCLFAKRK